MKRQARLRSSPCHENAVLGDQYGGILEAT